MFLQIILCKFIPMLPRVRLLPLHIDFIQQRHALRRELAVALARIVVCVLLACHPLAEGNVVCRGIGDGNIQIPVFLKIQLGCRISLTPLEVIIILFPPDSDVFQPRGFFLLQRAICIGLLLISYPNTQTQAVFGCVGHRHDQIAVFGVILGSCCKAALPLFAEGVPNHTDLFKAGDFFHIQTTSSLFGTLVGNPSSQWIPIRCFPVCRNHKIPVLRIVLLGFFIAFCPSQVVVVVPAHTDAV